jgi:hypothetical protein
MSYGVKTQRTTTNGDVEVDNLDLALYKIFVLRRSLKYEMKREDLSKSLQ